MSIGYSFANFFTNPKIVPIVCFAVIYMLGKSNNRISSKLIWNADSYESFFSYMPSCVISLLMGGVFFWGMYKQNYVPIELSVTIILTIFFVVVCLLSYFIIIKKHITNLNNISDISEGLVRYANADMLTAKQLKFAYEFVNRYEKGYCPEISELRMANKIFNVCEKKHGGAFREFKNQQELERKELYQQAYDKYFSEHPELFEDKNKLESALSLFMFDDINELTEDELKKRYRGLQKSFHADNGGNDELSLKINEAYDLLKQYV